jgi:type II secretory pathway pseudopilin PulG
VKLCGNPQIIPISGSSRLKVRGRGSDATSVRIAPVQSPASREDGFILIEVLVSALILAIVAAGVMAVLSSATHSAASERVRAQASALAQEDQARMRTMRISTLQRLEEERKGIKLDGTEFTVVSKGIFVGSASNEIVCGSETSVTDYVRITSTVTTPSMPNGVVLTSMVAPSNGSLDQTHGTLSFTAKNAKGLPLSGVSISATNPTAFSGKTDSTGCANFADLLATNYKVTTSANGLINMKGETSTLKEIGVQSAATTTVPLTYDAAGEIEAEFTYKDPTTGVLTKGAKADSIAIYNGESGGLARTAGTPGGDTSTRVSKLVATNVFPFKSKTTVYAGSCESNNPDPKELIPANRAAMTFVEVPSGGKPLVYVQLPVLNLTVKSSSGPINGASVTLTDQNCTFGSNPVKRTGYVTNANGNLTEPWMPSGEYTICARAVVNGSTRKVEATKVVNDLAAATPLTMEIKSNSSTSSCS